MWGRFEGYTRRLGAAAVAATILLPAATGSAQPLDPAPTERRAVQVPPPPPPPRTADEPSPPSEPVTSAPPSAPTPRTSASGASAPPSADPPAPVQPPPPADAAAGGGQQPAVVALGPPEPINVSTEEPPPPRPRSYWARTGTVFAPRVGIGVFGDGNLTFDGTCTGECPVAIVDQTVPVSDKTRARFGVEILRAFRSPMRFGVGFHYVPRIAVKPDSLIDADEEEEKSLGASLELPLVLEGVVPTSDTVGIAIRGVFGPALFFPGGAWAQDNQAFAEFCDEQSGADKCRVRRFLRGAWTYGIGAGPVLVVGPATAVRADLLFQFTNVKLFKFRAEDRDWEARQEYRLDGYRLWAVLGLEVM